MREGGFKREGGRWPEINSKGFLEKAGAVGYYDLGSASNALEYRRTASLTKDTNENAVPICGQSPLSTMSGRIIKIPHRGNRYSQWHDICVTDWNCVSPKL